VDEEVRGVRAGIVEILAVSPGGHPVYVIRYGEKDDLRSQANYNSAVAAGNPAWYARKDETTRPVVLFLGPVHGQEVEGIVGLVNLIHVAETGADHRGRPWPELKRRLDRFRVLIVPSANPDGSTGGDRGPTTEPDGYGSLPRVIAASTVCIAFSMALLTASSRSALGRPFARVSA
jgi:hypothetical protein